MTKKDRARHNEIVDETAELKSRLEETEETLHAIQQYMVDAFVVNRDNGIQVVTLNESEIPYRMMVESMNEGAVTLIPDGTIFYCNSRFGEMVERDCETLIGTAFTNLIAPDEASTFNAILAGAAAHSVRAEFHLQAKDGTRIPVQLSVYQLSADEMSGIAVIATDIRERIQAEEKIRTLASKLTLVEQEERHRISQVLHDDLQQRLFALKAQLSFLSDVPEKDQISASTFAELVQIQESLSEAIAITRNLSIDLNPVVMQGEGLAEAMTWLAFRMKEQYGLQINIEAKEHFNQLDQHIRMLLFQSIRELLFNVVKHAGVSEATISMEQTNGLGLITVTDGGKGFDAEGIMRDAKLAHGLLVVQDRLNLLGCGMQVQSKPGQGTRVVIKIPMQRSAA